MAWERVCNLKERGGLDVRNLVVFNQASLDKWLWHFAGERERL